MPQIFSADCQLWLTQEWTDSVQPGSTSRHDQTTRGVTILQIHSSVHTLVFVSFLFVFFWVVGASRNTDDLCSLLSLNAAHQDTVSNLGALQSINMWDISNRLAVVWVGKGVVLRFWKMEPWHETVDMSNKVLILEPLNLYKSHL